jgi:UDP-glucose 4-epimerase
MTKVLITGGFGFIGGHLINRLLANGDALERKPDVHVVDNLSTSPVPLEVLLDDLDHPARLTYDIMSIYDWLRNGTGDDWDVIYHLASPVGPAGILPYAGKMAHYIMQDTVGLIALAKRCNAQLIDISTSEIYGGGQDGLCSEDMPRIVPPETTVRLEYAVGKLAAETAILNECHINGLKASIIRPFNVAGPRQSGKGGFVLPRFVAQAMTGEPLTVFGDGSQLRAFTHVDDIVDGIVRTSQRGKQGIYNLGNPANRISILELAEIVRDVVNSHSDIVFMDGREVYGKYYAEAANKFPDASKAMKELRWKPMKGVEETVQSVYHYMTFSMPDTFEALAGFEVEHPLWTSPKHSF